MNERSWDGGNGARSVKREKLRLWRKKTLPLLSSFYKPSGGGLPPALCCQEPSPVTFSFRIHHQMPTSDHSHLPPASQVRKSLWRASRRFAAAVIFLYEDIVMQKRTNVAKVCQMKTILRCLRDLAFRGVIGSVMPLYLPSEVDHCSPGLCYTRSPCSLAERV